MSASEMRCFVHFQSFNDQKLKLLETVVQQHHDFYVNGFGVGLKLKPNLIRHSGHHVH